MTEAPGAKMLKVVGVLMAIFGAIGVITGLIAVFGASVSQVLYYEMFRVEIGVATLVVDALVGLIVAIVVLIAGIMGIKNAADVSKAGMLKSLGIVCAILAVIRAVVGFILLSALGIGAMAIVTLIFGLVLPILYILGASKNAAA